MKDATEPRRTPAELVRGTLHRMLYVFRVVWETKHWILFQMIFFAVYDGLIPVCQAMIHAGLLNAVTAAITRQEIEGIYFFLFLELGYRVINSVVRNIRNILSRISGELVTNTIKLRIIEKSKEVDLSSFDCPDFYERLENANREAGNRPVQILKNMFSVLSTLISVVIYISAMAAVLPYAPVLILVVSIPSAIVNFIYRRKNFNYMRKRSIDRREMNYYSNLLVNKDMVKEIRLFGLADRFIDGYRKVFVKYFGGLKKLIYAEGGWHVFFSLLSTAVDCFLYIVIAKNVIFGSGLIGDFTFYTGAINSIANGFATLITTTATIYEGTLFIDNLIVFMNEEKHITPRLSEKNPEPLHIRRHAAHTVVFDHVCFRYPGAEKDVLHDICLTLRSGETCVLVGLNGAGKTTLIKLLTRLYDPTAGTIYLDGEDIRSYDTAELYRMYGIIFQDYGRYAFSVADNIALGDIDRPQNREEVTAAAEHADASFIAGLPEQFDTPLMRIFSENGTELSIGQWQKLAIARAFYSDSDFLILDEPTASLDAIAEQEVFRQFDDLRRDKTTLFVSHRLSSAVTADHIIVLENGTLVEEGNHESLMHAKGKYYTLFTAQAERYIATAEEGLIGDEELPPDGQKPKRGKQKETGEDSDPYAPEFPDSL